MNQKGYLVKLPDGDLGWIVFDGQGGEERAKYLTVYILDASGLKLKQTPDGRYYGSVTSFSQLKILGGLF